MTYNIGPQNWPTEELVRTLIRCKIESLRKWLGWQDSNLRMPVPKTSALPLGYTPAEGRSITAYARM